MQEVVQHTPTVVVVVVVVQHGMPTGQYKDAGATKMGMPSLALQIRNGKKKNSQQNRLVAAAPVQANAATHLTPQGHSTKYWILPPSYIRFSTATATTCESYLNSCTQSEAICVTYF